MINYINPTSQFHQLNSIWTKSPNRVNSSPSILNFSQNIKLIKLNTIDHVYNIVGQRPNDQFHKIRFEPSKTPKYAKSENNLSMHEKLKINEKERVIWTYRLMERETLQEIRRKTTKKLLWSLVESEREKKFWKAFEKVIWISQIWIFKNLILDIRLIETDRDSIKILNTISIDRKTDWINQNFGKTEFLKKINRFLKKFLKALNIRNKMHDSEMKCFSKTQDLNLVFPKFRFSNILPLISQAPNMFCIRTQSICKLSWSDRKTHTITCTMFSKE